MIGAFLTPKERAEPKAHALALLASVRAIAAAHPGEGPHDRDDREAVNLAVQAIISESPLDDQTALEMILAGLGVAVGMNTRANNLPAVQTEMIGHFLGGVAHGAQRPDRKEERGGGGIQ